MKKVNEASSQMVKRKAVHSKAHLNELFVKYSTNINIYIKRCHQLIKDG